MSDNLLFDLLDPGNFLHESSSESLSKKQWEWQKEKYDENFAEQKRHTDWFEEMTGAQLAYQRNLNAVQMEREDNAVQRRVADLKSAGLSPTLAAGSAAAAAPMHAGSVGQPTAPQYEVGENPRIQAAMFKQQMMKDNIALASSILGNVADISKTKAETELLKAQTNNLNTMTPVEFKLKEQLLEFNEEFNPYRIADVISGIENRHADTYYKERQKFLVDSQIVLNNDEHGMNILRQVGLALDNDLKRTNLTLDNQMYIKNAISIELLRQEYRHTEDIFNFNKNFYNYSHRVPINFSMSPWTSYYGLGINPDGTSNKKSVNAKRTDDLITYNSTDHPPVSDFVVKQFDKATNFLKETGIYKTLMNIVSGQISTGGPFDFH